MRIELTKTYEYGILKQYFQKEYELILLNFQINCNISTI